MSGPNGGRIVRLITCIGVDHDLALLPHFVDHYRALGIAPRDMIAILNTPDPDSPQLREARDYCAGTGLQYKEWIAPYTSGTMWEKRREVQNSACDAHDWVVSADVDEFHLYPEPLPDFLDRCERLGVNVVQGVFVDRLQRAGKLTPVEPGGSVSEQFPLSAAAMGTVGAIGRHHSRHSTVKVMALREGIMPARGGHDPLPDRRLRWLYGASLGQFTGIDRAQYRFDVPTRVDHYHWTDRLRPSLEQRIATPGASAAGREYGARQLDYLDRNDGIAMKDIAIDPQPFPKNGWERRLSSMRRKGAAMTLAYRLRTLLLRRTG